MDCATQKVHRVDKGAASYSYQNDNVNFSDKNRDEQWVKILSQQLSYSMFLYFYFLFLIFK